MSAVISTGESVSTFNGNEELLRQGIVEHAVYLGMDPIIDSKYLWIAEQSLLAPLPPFWTQCIHQGQVYFFNTQTGHSSWQHPCDDEYRQIFITTKQEDQESEQIKKSNYMPAQLSYSSDRETAFALENLTENSLGYTKYDKVKKSWTDIFNDISLFLKNRINESEIQDRLTDPEYTSDDISQMVEDLHLLIEELIISHPFISKPQMSQEKNESIETSHHHSMHIVLSDMAIQTDVDGLKMSVTNEFVRESIVDKQNNNNADDENCCIVHRKESDHFVKHQSDSNEGLISKEFQTYEGEINNNLKIIKDLKYQNRLLNQNMTSCQNELERDQLFIKKLESQKTLMDESLKNTQDELEKVNVLSTKMETKNIALKKNIKETMITLNGNQMQLEEYEQILYQFECSVSDLNIEIKKMEERINFLTCKIEKQQIENNKNMEQTSRWRSKYLDEREKLKIVRKTLSDFQGNIRVLCRVRQLTNETADLDCSEKEERILHYFDDDKIRYNNHNFEFDYIFKPSAGQKKVFDEISNDISNVMSGETITIIAYGQTSSGKTFTMEGPEHDRGIYLRSLSTMFETASKLETEIDYTFNLSIIEIYNEVVIDLIGSSVRSLHLLNDEVKVKNIVEKQVAELADAEKVIKNALTNRKKGDNNINSQSSRSHLIINVNVEGREKSGKVIQGRLHLVDLAGSERLKSTNVTGLRLREAQNINRSLSSFGDVLEALGSKKSHIPYRNSTLTFSLKNSLRKGAKVIMFVNINPSASCCGENMCSLNFAQRCRAVKLGRVRKCSK